MANTNTVMFPVSGVPFDLANPDPDKVRLEDIAWALSMLPRFTGATEGLVSVATHTMSVVAITERLEAERLEYADEDPTQAVRFAALHDAEEAYIGDVSSPLKYLLGESYRKVALRVRRAILVRYVVPNWGLSTTCPRLPYVVYEADALALEAERRMYMHYDPKDWPEDNPPPDWVFEIVDQKHIWDSHPFMHRFNEFHHLLQLLFTE